MNNAFDTSQANETVELTLPLNGAYVSAARLTVASIANRLGFDVDEIEDLKSALSEACIYIIKKSPPDFRGTFRITFLMNTNLLKIKIETDTQIASNETDEEIGLVMINALMDELSVVSDSDLTQIVMQKQHKKTTF